MLLFLLNNWRVVALAVTISVLSATAGFYRWSANRWETKYEDFVVEVRAAGLAAEAKAKAKEEADKKTKETVDAKYRTDLSKLRADNDRLRSERASRVYLPPSAPGAGGSETTCLATADAERAIRDFIEAASGLITEGDEARAALDNAKVWSQSLQR